MPSTARLRCKRERRIQMANFIVAALLLVILGAAARYVIQARKRGVKCIGCPDGGCCHGGEGGCACGHQSHCSGCHSE